MPIVPYVLRGHSRNLTQVKFNRESDLLVTCARDDAPIVWYAKNGECLGTFEGHTGAILSCDISFDSKKLITGSGDMSVHLWEMYTGKLIRKYEFPTIVRSVAFCVGDFMFAGITNKKGSDKATVRLYDLEDEVETPIRTFVNTSDANFTKVIWGPLNEYVLTVDEKGMLIKWDIEDEKPIKSLALDTAQLTDISLSNDRLTALISSKSSSAYLVDLTLMEVKKTYKSNRPLNSCAINPINNHIIIGGGQDANDVTLSDSKEGHFEADIWHIYYEEKLASISGHFGPINTLDISPDGKKFVSGGEDGEIRLYHFDDAYLNSTY